MSAAPADVPGAGRYPLLAMGMVALGAGLWSGLVRMGWAWPLPQPALVAAHGPLMVCGFLGTLIALERAVALRRWWAYAVPLGVGAGGLLLTGGWGGMAGPLLLTAGSAGLVGVYAVLLRRQAEPFLLVMALGAVAWLAGNATWLAGASVRAAVPLWAGFLVLTIAGERLELSRMLGHAPRVQHLFLAIAVGLTAALVMATAGVAAGVRVAGAALVALALWLAHYDVARYTVRRQGLTRFIAACLLAGYAWMAVAGLIALAGVAPVAGPLYDALLHALFVGFVFSMIFGHAPLIFPAVLGVQPFYHPVFYVPLALLHASLLLRVGGDLAGWPGLRQWGGLLSAVAIVLFLAGVGFAMRANRRAAPRSPA